jgi:outer membrane protein assembly factor BamD (BamD/ComL family)
MKMLIVFALALLAGCAQAPAQTPAPLSGAASSDGLYAVGTLARTGTCEMDVAADFTALIAYRHRAARMVAKGQITVEQATYIQAQADSARADLDAACPDASARLNVAKRDRARATLKNIVDILE